VKESEVPWDLTPMIPNAVSPPLPLLSRLAGVFLPSSSLSSSSFGLLVLMGGFAGLAAWGWSRSNRRAPRIAALVGLSGLVVTGALDTGAIGSDPRSLFYPPFRDYFAGWLDLEGRSGTTGARVAYAGTNIPYYLFGVGLRNDIRYVNV